VGTAQGFEVAEVVRAGPGVGHSRNAVRQPGRVAICKPPPSTQDGYRKVDQGPRQASAGTGVSRISRDYTQQSRACVAELISNGSRRRLRRRAHRLVARWPPGRATGPTTLRAALRAVLGRGRVARQAFPAGAPPQPTRLMRGWIYNGPRTRPAVGAGRGLRSLTSPRDRPTPPQRHQGRRWRR
jgi:hypothetical protein